MDGRGLGDLGGRAFRRALGVPAHGMPRSVTAARAVLASHVARKSLTSWLERTPVAQVVRQALAEAVFLESTRVNFGANAMIRGGQGFFPHIFMPEYHGPHFAEACARVAFSGLGPNILYLSLTGVCPCRCDYCFAGAGPEAPDLGDSALHQVSRAVARLRVPLVNISGGEPLARYDRLLRTIAQLAAGSEVRMFTSGIGLSPERLRALREAGLRGIFVSLDTDDTASFDRARGRAGAHNAATTALARCAEANMLTFVNCVVGPRRFPHDADIERFLSFVEAIDPRIVVNFLPQLATGRGADADSFRTPEECAPVAERIVATARRLARPASMLFGRVDRFMGCPGAGGKLLNVDVTGNVTVCISRASLGNLLQEPFEDIYARYVTRCHRLKVGFFCAQVGEAGDAPLLSREQTEEALATFYRDHEDAEWQRTMDRFGWLISGLLTPQGSTPAPRDRSGHGMRRHGVAR